ncbi:hypothetical protein BGZ82_003481, partial [Podila clonocystis]
MTVKPMIDVVRCANGARGTACTTLLKQIFSFRLRSFIVNNCIPQVGELNMARVVPGLHIQTANTILLFYALSMDGTSTTQSVQVQHIRNATVKITYADTTFLVDPMIGRKGAYPGFEGTYRSHLRNPMIELPMPAENVIEGVDAVIVSHTHLDHWDDVAQELLPKGIPLFAQHETDAQIIRAQGFSNVRILGEDTVFEGVHLAKTGGAAR